MERKKTYEECMEMLNRVVVLRSFMSGKSKQNLEQACGGHNIRHFLNKPDLLEIAEEGKAYREHPVIVLRAKTPVLQIATLKHKDLQRLIDNCRFLLSEDLFQN